MMKCWRRRATTRPSRSGIAGRAAGSRYRRCASSRTASHPSPSLSSAHGMHSLPSTLSLPPTDVHVVVAGLQRRIRCRCVTPGFCAPQALALVQPGQHGRRIVGEPAITLQPRNGIRVRVRGYLDPDHKPDPDPDPDPDPASAPTCLRGLQGGDYRGRCRWHGAPFRRAHGHGTRRLAGLARDLRRGQPRRQLPARRLHRRRAAPARQTGAASCAGPLPSAGGSAWGPLSRIFLRCLTYYSMAATRKEMLAGAVRLRWALWPPLQHMLSFV